jgi:hypothetical protein
LRGPGNPWFDTDQSDVISDHPIVSIKFKVLEIWGYQPSKVFNLAMINLQNSALGARGLLRLPILFLI